MLDNDLQRDFITKVKFLTNLMTKELFGLEATQIDEIKLSIDKGVYNNNITNNCVEKSYNLLIEINLLALDIISNCENRGIPVELVECELKENMIAYMTVSAMYKNLVSIFDKQQRLKIQMN